MVQVRIGKQEGVVERGGVGTRIDGQAANMGMLPYKLNTSGSTPVSSVAATDPPGFYLLAAATAGVTASLPEPGAAPGAVWILTNANSSGTFFVTASARSATSQPPFGANTWVTTTSLLLPAGAGRKAGDFMQVTGSVTLMSDGIRYMPLAVSGNVQFGP